MTTLPVQDMVHTAQMLLDANTVQTQELEGTLQDLRSDLSNLQAQFKARLQASSSYEDMLQAALEDEQRAEAYAALSKGTPKEQSAIKAASAQRKTFQAVQKDYDQQKAEKDQLDRADQTRELELSAQIQATQKELDGVRAARGKITLGHQQAHNELGAAKHQAHMQAYHAKQQEVERLKGLLVTAQMDAHDAYTEALDDMAAWPEHYNDILVLEDVSDETMDMLKTTLYYVDMLFNIKHMRQEDRFVQLPSFQGDIRNAGIVHHGMIQIALGNSTNGERELRLFKENLERYIEEYRTYARSEE